MKLMQPSRAVIVPLKVPNIFLARYVDIPDNKELCHHNIAEHSMSTGEIVKPNRPLDFIFSLWCSPLSSTQYQKPND